VEKLYLTGYTPYPAGPNDSRLPHIAAKINRQISKTALGAEDSVSWEHSEEIGPLLEQLADDGFEVAALEQSQRAVDLHRFAPPAKLALVIGNEAAGLDSQTLDVIDIHLQIPMLGRKESFNVANAAAMALFYARFFKEPSG
jgi:tRNA G18 (ribose-2'-O)-methylase SpoU